MNDKVMDLICTVCGVGTPAVLHISFNLQSLENALVFGFTSAIGASIGYLVKKGWDYIFKRTKPKQNERVDQVNSKGGRD